MPTKIPMERFIVDIFFSDPEDAPVPPDEVRIRRLEARAWPDGERIAVQFSITPFQVKPNLELEIRNPVNELAAELSVVEVIQNEMDFTLHLRGEILPGDYSVRMKVLYTDLDKYDQEKETESDAGEILKESSRITDQAETTCTLPPEESETE